LQPAESLFYSAHVSAPSIPARVPLIAAIAIVVGNMVGTGIFSSLGFQVRDMPSGFPILLLWLLGGALSFFGAVNYAELTAALPRSGGEYQLLSRVYHPGVGFVAGWISMIAAFPAPVAAAALVFGRQICDLAGGESETVAKLAAAGLVILITGAHLVSVMFSGRFQWMATGLKLLLLVILALCGFFLPASQPVHFFPRPGDGSMIAQPAFFVSLIYVLYTYSGWNAACYIAGEMEKPEKNVPRALLIGTGIVTILYLGVNAAMLYAVPMADLARAGDGLAYETARHTFSGAGVQIMAGLIAAGLASAVSAMTWAGPRVTQQMGIDYPFLGVLSRTNSGGVPWVAVLLQSTVAILLIFSFDVEAIMTRTTFLLEAVLLLTVWGVVHLRIREPNLPRPYRAWGYPYTTILFLIMIGFTLAFILRERPEDTRWGLGVLITGVAFYMVARTPKRA
jgi:APA family basic amino acid/polyamine antiporter